MPFNTLSIIFKGKICLQQLLIVTGMRHRRFLKKKKSTNVSYVIPPQTLSKTLGAFVFHESQDFEAEESLWLLYILLKISNFSAKNGEATGFF